MLSCNVLDMGRISGYTYWISPGELIYDKPSNTRHVLHSFYFLGVAPLARMSWDLVCWFSGGLHVHQLQLDGLCPPLGCTLS